MIKSIKYTKYILLYTISLVRSSKSPVCDKNKKLKINRKKKKKRDTNCTRSWYSYEGQKWARHVDMVGRLFSYMYIHVNMYKIHKRICEYGNRKSNT